MTIVDGTQLYHDGIKRIQELEKLNSVLGAEVDRMRNVNAESVTYLADVEVVCTRCQQPIRAKINTQQWIRVEWIGPEGECAMCYQAAKGASYGNTGQNSAISTST